MEEYHCHHNRDNSVVRILPFSGVTRFQDLKSSLCFIDQQMFLQFVLWAELRTDQRCNIWLVIDVSTHNLVAMLSMLPFVVSSVIAYRETSLQVVHITRLIDNASRPTKRI